MEKRRGTGPSPSHLKIFGWILLSVSVLSAAWTSFFLPQFDTLSLNIVRLVGATVVSGVWFYLSPSVGFPGIVQLGGRVWKHLPFWYALLAATAVLAAEISFGSIPALAIVRTLSAAVTVLTLTHLICSYERFEAKRFHRIFAGHFAALAAFYLVFPQAGPAALFLSSVFLYLLVPLSLIFRSIAKTRTPDRVFILSITLALTFFYWWSAATAVTHKIEFFSGFGSFWRISKLHSDSTYLLQAEGFRSGSLGLNVEVSKELLASPNPYPPANRNFEYMHDMTYFKGKYYSYFGIVPVALLYYPVLLAFDRYVSDPQAIVFFGVLAAFAALSLTGLIIRKYFPATPAWLRFAAYVFMASNNVVTHMNKTPRVYEIAIVAAYCFIASGLYFMIRAKDAQKPARFVALSGICFGLSVGCRPLTLLLSAILPLWLWFNRDEKRFRFKSTLITAAISLGSIGFLLGLYNFLRFGSWTEFGYTYQLTHIEIAKAHREWIMIYHGLWLFFLTHAKFDLIFPFFHISGTNPFPKTYDTLFYDAIGIFWLAPALILFLIVPALYFLGEFRKSIIGQITPWLLVLMFGEAAAVCYLGMGVTARYTLDFSVFGAIAAVVAVLFVHSDFAWAPLRRSITGAFCAAVLYGSVFSFFLGFDGQNHLMAQFNPDLMVYVQRVIGY